MLSLLQSLEDQDAAVRKWAAYRLGELGPGARTALPALRAVAHDPDGYVRVHTALALWKIGSETTGLAPVTEALHEGDEALQSFAAHVLGEMGKEVNEAAPALHAMLQSQPAGMVRVHAAEALWKLGRDEGMSTAILVSELSAGDKHTRWLAAYALGAMAPPRPEAVAALVGALDDQEACVRTAAAFALGNLGSASAPGVPRLLEILQYSLEDEDLRMAAFHALHAIDPETAMRIEW